MEGFKSDARKADIKQARAKASPCYRINSYAKYLYILILRDGCQPLPDYLR